MKDLARTLDALRTPDSRYIVVRGRLWRASNPALPDDERARLARALMSARRAVAKALRDEDQKALRRARQRVDRTKRALGERGPVWWTDGTADVNRRLVRNTTYADWYARAERIASAMQNLLVPGRGSICPSDVARTVDSENWRELMDETREVAQHLARQGGIVITQRGQPVDPDAPVRGPIRLARAQPRQPRSTHDTRRP